MRDLRIAHIADTHLGYRASYVSGRDEDFARSWMAACRAIVDSKPDLIIHAGDIFHHPHPSWGAVGDFFNGAHILREAGVPIVMITGNHDSSRLHLKRTVFSIISEMIPYITLANEKEPTLLHLAELDANLVLLPHPCLLNPLIRRKLDDATEQLTDDRHNILVAHGDIRKRIKAEDPEHGSIAIPEFIFDFDWSYVALGHLHMAQPFGRKGWYSGSIERCGWSDYPANPAWTLVNLVEGRPASHVQVRLPHRDMRQLPTLICVDTSDFDIQDEVMRIIDREKLTDEPTIIRVVLDGVSNQRSYHLERAIREAVRLLYPNVFIQVLTKNAAQPRQIAERETRVEKHQTIAEMFQEFISGRSYPDEGTKDFVLEKGTAALRKAQENMVAADTGDERSVATG